MQDIYASFDSVGASLSDYELTMRQIPDIQWERSAKRNAPSLFVGNKKEEEDWIAANAAEVPPPKQPIKLLEKGFEMLSKTFDAFEVTMAGKQPRGPNVGANKDEGTTPRRAAPVALMRGWKEDKRARPSSHVPAASANRSKKSKERTARDSTPVAQMIGHKTSERTSEHKGSTSRMNGVEKNADEGIPAKKMFSITQRTKSLERSSTYSPPSTASKGSPPQRAIKRANIGIEDDRATTEKPQHHGSDNSQLITQRPKSSKRSSTFSPPNTSSKRSPLRTIKRARTQIEDDLASEKPQHLGSDKTRPIIQKSKTLKRSSTLSTPNTSSKGSPVRTIKQAAARTENDLAATEKPQHRGSNTPQARADTNNKHASSESNDIVGIDTSSQAHASKGDIANGPKSQGGSSSPHKQKDLAIDRYGYSPVKEKSARDPQQPPRKYKTCEYSIKTARYKPMLI